MSQRPALDDPSYHNDREALDDPSLKKSCPICGGQFVSIGRRIYCSANCKHRAYRRRHQGLVSNAIVGISKPRRNISIYECPSCGVHELGIQRCSDCGVFMTRVGIGGLCPHCDEPLAVGELMGEI